MEEKIISTMHNAGICGVISISLFFVFFTGALVWAFAMKKNYLNKMGALPLDSGERADQANETSQR
jgi:hypothetical protein